MVRKCAVCSSCDHLLRCSRCKSVFYCSKEHQMEHWATHKTECITLLKKRPLPVHEPPAKIPRVSVPVVASFEAIPENIRTHPNLSTLTELTISLEYENESPEIDLAAEGLCFPELRSIKLSCVNLKSLTFTEANTPKLERAEFFNLLSACRMNLALPYLTVFNIEHSSLYEESIEDENQFGLSLSRCPSLVSLSSYKFRFLGDSNFCILPNCETITLHRSECTRHLEIWYAPKLTELSMQAAFSLEHLRLYNRPTATVAAIEKLTRKLREAVSTIGETVNEEINKWKTGVYTRDDALRLHWIESDEEFDIEDHIMEDILSDHAYSMSERLERTNRAPVLQNAVASHPDYPALNHPRCLVNIVNMNIDRTSKAHLQNIPYVHLQSRDPYASMF